MAAITICSDFGAPQIKSDTVYLLLRAGIPQKKWNSHHGQQKSPKWSTWMKSQKWQNDFCSFPRQAIQYQVIQVYASTKNAEEAEVEQFCENLQDLLELTPKKDALFIIGGWNAKVGSQETPGVTRKFGLGIQNEAGQQLTEFCQENALVIVNTIFQQHRRRPYTWTSPDGQHQNQIDYILCSQRGRNPIQSADQELTVAQIMNSLLPNSDLIEENRENH